MQQRSTALIGHVWWTVTGILLLSGFGLRSAHAQYNRPPTVGGYGYGISPPGSVMLYKTPSSGAITITSGAITLGAITSGAITSGAVLTKPPKYGTYGRRLLAGYERMPPGADYTAPAGLTATAPTVRAIPPPSTSSSTPSPARVTSGAIPSGAITSGAIPSGAITSGAVTYGARSSPGSYVGGRASTRAPLVSAKFGNGSCPATPLTVLESSPDLSSFTQLLTTFGLSRAVDNPTTFVTVFAPTNAAIAAAGIDPRDAMTTSAILENHILLGSRLLSSISSPVIQESQSGSLVSIARDDSTGAIRITSGSGSSAVTTASEAPPRSSCLGEVYVIDHVLQPTASPTG